MAEAFLKAILMRRIKRDKPTSGQVKQVEEATVAVTPDARPEAQILRLVHSREPIPFNPATLAIDWTLYWFRLWSSLVVR